MKCKNGHVASLEILRFCEECGEKVKHVISKNECACGAKITDKPYCWNCGYS